MNHIKMINAIREGDQDVVRKRLKSMSLADRMEALHKAMPYMSVTKEVTNFFKTHFGPEIVAITKAFASPELKAAIANAYREAVIEYREAAELAKQDA